MSKEQEAEDNLRLWGQKQQEASENLRVLGRRQSNADKIKIALAKALSECGEGHDFEAVRQAIGTAMSKVDQTSKKNFRRFKINQDMVELAKTKQKKWWESLQDGLKIKPSLEIPNIKKEIENDVE